METPTTLVPSQTIDWPGIRAAAIAMDSVNGVAIQAGKHLPPIEAERLRQRINKRALRERWIEKANAFRLSKRTNAKPLSHSVQSGSDSLAISLANDSKATRLSLSKAARKGADHLSRLPGAAITRNAQQLRHIVAASSSVHGWEERQDTGVVVNLLNVSGSTNI